MIPLPMWAAREVVDFGALVRLFSLILRSDQNEIATLMEVNDGRWLHGWLKSPNVSRNHCAPVFAATNVPTDGQQQCPSVDMSSAHFFASATAQVKTQNFHKGLCPSPGVWFL